MEIRSNRHWYPFKYRMEVPQKTLASEFDWIDEDELDGFFKHRGHWYHLSEFMISSIEGWQGQKDDTFFSALVINVSDDGDRYQIGLALA